jgi:hypothetical protein
MTPVGPPLVIEWESVTAMSYSGPPFNFNVTVVELGFGPLFVEGVDDPLLHATSAQSKLRISTRRTIQAIIGLPFSRCGDRGFAVGFTQVTRNHASAVFSKARLRAT